MPICKATCLTCTNSLLVAHVARRHKDGSLSGSGGSRDEAILFHVDISKSQKAPASPIVSPKCVAETFADSEHAHNTLRIKLSGNIAKLRALPPSPRLLECRAGILP